ncbi:MAG: type II toxin-antitoxin system VapB family antitoxin [Acidimicrobiales bacterium]
MALSIKNDDADRLARDLAATTGETLTDAVVVALRERLQRERGRRQVGIADRLRRLAGEVAEMEVLDPRPADTIVGYDRHGLPQ